MIQHRNMSLIFSFSGQLKKGVCGDMQCIWEALGFFCHYSEDEMTNEGIITIYLKAFEVFLLHPVLLCHRWHIYSLSGSLGQDGVFCCSGSLKMVLYLVAFEITDSVAVNS